VDDPPSPELAAEFEELLGVLKRSRGFYFTGYKRASLMRRVRHRMAEVGDTTFPQYVDRLELHAEEFTALFDTVLINVTSFFRDAPAWEQQRNGQRRRAAQHRSQLTLGSFRKMQHDEHGRRKVGRQPC